MPDYIPFPNGSDGNPRSIHPDFFVSGQTIKCAATATSPAAANSPLTVEATALIRGLGGVSLLDIDNGAYRYLNDDTATQLFVDRMYTPNASAANLSDERYTFITFGTSVSGGIEKTTTHNGVTIDWWTTGTAAAMIVVLASLTAEDFQAHVDELTGNIKASITNQLNGTVFDLATLRSNQSHFIIDPEIPLYDNLFINEITTYHLRADSGISTFNGVSDNEITTRGLYYTNSGFVAANANGVDGQARLAIMRDAMIEVVEHAKSILQHDKVSYYNMFGLFQDDVARISDGQGSNPSNTDPAATRAVYQGIKDNADLATLHAALYTNNIKYYPGNGFSATKTTFDIFLEEAQAVWPTRTSMWFNDNLRQQTNGVNAGNSIFDYDAVSGKWSNMEAKYRIDSYDVQASGIAGNYPSSAGVLAYIGQRCYDLNVQGIFLFAFGINDSIFNGTGIPASILTTYNNGAETVKGSDFEQFQTDDYYDWYFDTMTRFLLTGI